MACDFIDGEATPATWGGCTTIGRLSLSGGFSMNNAARTTIAAFETEFHKTKSSCDAAMAQLTDAELHARINPRQNSIAVIVQHLHGNMRSRWTDFLTTDGEKPDRDREAEFAERALSRIELTAL